MEFIKAYKRLEKLCGEVMGDDRRVSAYIEEMQNTPRGAFLVNGWEDDLKRLKHYRWVRNRIVHDPDCTEETMCVPEDSLWVMDFYSRIMRQTDPLALYRKATQTRTAVVPKKTGVQQPKVQSDYHDDEPYRDPFGAGVGFLIAAAAAVLAAVWILLGI